MRRAVVAAVVDPRPAAERVPAAVRERIGDERFAVWFGGAIWQLAPDGKGIVVQAGAGLTHEWLRRTFRRDVEAAVAAVCGPHGSVTWAAVPASASASGALAGGGGHSAGGGEGGGGGGGVSMEVSLARPMTSDADIEHVMQVGR